VDCAPGLHQYCEEENYPVAIAIYDGRPVVISNRRTDMYGNLDYYGDGKGTWNVMIQRKVTLDDGSQVFTSQYDGGWTDLDPTTVNQGGLQASLGSESSKAVRAAGVFGDDPQWLVIVGASGLLWTRNLNTDYFSDGSGNQGILNTGNIEAIDGFEHFDVTDWRGVTEFMGRVFVVGEYEHEGQMHWAIAHAPINAVLWDESSWRVYDDIFSYDADSALTYPMVDIVGTDSFLQLHYEQRTLPFASWMKVLRWTP